jgi:hypothetical protein
MTESKSKFTTFVEQNECCGIPENQVIFNILQDEIVAHHLHTQIMDNNKLNNYQCYGASTAVPR